MSDSGNKPIWVWLAIATIIGILLALTGFDFVHHDRNDMGFAIFVVLPTVIGFIVATLVRRLAWATVTAITVLALALAFLLLQQKEGFVCCLMALPLLVVFATVGAILAFIVAKLHERDRKRSAAIKLLSVTMAPLLVLAADRLERAGVASPREETISSSVRIARPSGHLWDLIKELDRIDAPKPFLLRIGLPVPLRCEMSGEGVGSKRTCHFNNGVIEERVSEWRPPLSLKMDIVAVTLPGRRWLHFKSAEYEFRSEGDSTVITRRTTIASLLSPAWYWRPLEHWGVESEHNYLFAELMRRSRTQ